MKVMVFVKATPDSENGAPPDPKMMEAMGKYNETLIAAGILKDMVLGGLKPTRFAKRVHFSGQKRTVIDGPFTETKEVVAGFWLWEVESIEEAVEWLKKCPNPMLVDSDIDIRPLYSMEDVARWKAGMAGKEGRSAHEVTRQGWRYVMSGTGSADEDFDSRNPPPAVSSRLLEAHVYQPREGRLTHPVRARPSRGS